MEFLFHMIAGLSSWSLLPLGMQFSNLSILTASHFFFKQPLVLFYSAFKLWWFSLVPCWIRFPTPIHMLHFDLGCENHTTSKMTIFHQISAFLHTTVFWSGCQLQPPVRACLGRFRKIFLSSKVNAYNEEHSVTCRSHFLCTINLLWILGLTNLPKT